MIQWMLSPISTEVAKYIDCYWFLEKTPDSDSYSYPKLNPDPAAHIVLSPPQQPYSYDLKVKKVAGIGSHWIFPHTQTFQLNHSKPFLHLGIKFHIGALYSFNITPSQPVLDEVSKIDKEALFKTDVRISESIFAVAKKHPKQCCVKLDRALSPWLTTSIEDNHSQLCRKVLPLLANTPISELSSILNCSQRTIERSFRRVTGLTLKQCQSMNRLEDMLEYLYQRDANKIDWVQVAYQFGFSDQPHLIRYLKNSIGSTPRLYGNQRDLTIDIYGGVGARDD